MLKIDIHTHILPESWPDLDALYGARGFVRIVHDSPHRASLIRGDKVFRVVERNCWDPATRIEECDRQGIDVQVLSTVPVMFSYWARPLDGLDLAKRLNDHIASCVTANPRRFIGLGTLPLQAPELAIAELERCVRVLGLAGVQIGTNVNGRNLDAPDLLPVFEAAQDLGAAVFVHPWEMLGAERMEKYWLPWLVGMPAETAVAIASLVFSGVLEKLPRLRIAFAHGGGSFPSTIGRIAHGFEARPDLCAVDNDVNPREYLRRIYVDALVHDPLALRYLVEVMGADRIALGSDYPFPLGEDKPGSLIEATFDDPALRARLLSGTALEWLGAAASKIRRPGHG